MPHPALVPLTTIDPTRLGAVRLLATDVDGTMTREGRIPASVLDRLASLARAGIEVVPVTGRSSGEALALARYLPGVRRALAENGAVLVQPDRPLQALQPSGDRDALVRLLASIDPTLTLAPCHPFRLVDVAFERNARDDATLMLLAEAAASHDLHVTWSTVHVHFGRQPPDKGRGLQSLIDDTVPAAAIATIGDAPNDTGLWDRARFGVTVGTADIAAHTTALRVCPEFVAAAGVDGWLQLTAALLSARAGSR